MDRCVEMGWRPSKPGVVMDHVDGRFHVRQHVHDCAQPIPDSLAQAVRLGESFRFFDVLGVVIDADHSSVGSCGLGDPPRRLAEAAAEVQDSV